ncbi:hypothetical protein DFH06DRAFT_1209706, partial [Mycena polygramma]
TLSGHLCMCRLCTLLLHSQRFREVVRGLHASNCGSASCDSLGQFGRRRCGPLPLSSSINLALTLYGRRLMLLRYTCSPTVLIFV